MKRILIISFVFFLLCTSGALVTVSSGAQSETSKGKKISARKHAASGTLLKAPEPTCSSAGCSHLLEGMDLMKQGMYAESLERFKAAYREIPLVGDYALFFMAKAYAGSKDFSDSNSMINTLLDAYPDTILKKRARSLQIRNLIPNSDALEDAACADIIKSLERYVNDYPDDMELTFLFGKVLKKLGRKEQAKKTFRMVYATASSFSDAAYRELEASDITAEDMLSKASAYMKGAEYGKAETLLRKALIGAGDPLREEILKKLAMSLFRQKRYREASAEYTRAGALYDAARALYRAGDIEAFSSTVGKLVSMEDKRAGSLLILLASKKRREGKTGEALRLFDDVRKTYPSHAEEALWGTAWTCYRARDFEKALEVLTELSSSHPDSRYRYWKARCTVVTGQGEASPSAGSSPNLIKSERQDFYSLLAEMRRRGTMQGELCTAGRSAPSDEDEVEGRLVSRPSLPVRENSPAVSRALERFFILVAIGMKEDAVAEISGKSGEFSNPDVLLYLGQVLRDAGAYKSAIALISRLSRNQETRGKTDTNLDGILYPLAYWSIVEEAAKDNGIDPLILLAVMREESRFDPGARSAAGAVGLMQLMPQTAQRLSRRTVMTANDIADVKTNIKIGAYYFGILLKEFRSLPVAIAAYNAGEEKVREWLSQGNYRSFDEFIEDIPYDETRNYVRKVLMTYDAYTQQTVQDTSACSPQVSR
jgi:soluble lytic murein transglycosylase